MGDIIELVGASGAAYRFRRANLAELPATAGNLLIITGETTSLRVLFCATARSLAGAGPMIRETLQARADAHLFIRLNIARPVREAEHADIVAAYAPDVEELDLE